MIDFYWTQASLLTTFLCLLLYSFFIIHYYKTCTIDLFNSSIPKNNSWLFIWSAILVIYLCIDNDWYHYQQMVWNYDFSVGAINYGEKIYGLIARIVNKNYILFRIIVWGGALLLSKQTFERYEVNVNAAIYFLISVFVLKFGYARSTLGMACYFYGLSFWTSPLKGKKLLSITIGCLFFWLSTLFHSSCSVLVALTISIFLPINKFTVVGSFILLPILGIYLKSFFDLISLSGSLSDEYLINRMNSYSDRIDNQANLFGIISNIIMYGTFFIPLIGIVVIVLKDTMRLTCSQLKLFKVTFSLTILSITFLFTGLSTNVYFYRLLFMTFIPISIFVVALYKKGYLTKKYFKLILYWGIVSNLYRILLMIYKISNNTYILD